MIHRFCITHKEPLLPESWYDDCIALGDFQPDSEFHVRQLDRFWHEARPLAYGAAGTHVLPIAIDKLSTGAELIEISSYRKRVLPSREGIDAPKYATVRELCLGKLCDADKLSEFEPRVDLGFLIAQPLYLKNSVIGNYALSHRRKDILDYTSLAVELGVLDPNSVAELLAAKHFIPGGVELGIYPKGWLVDALTKIELIGKQFLIRYGDRLKTYNAYQVRALGFLSERLGSFLLIRHLMQKYPNGIPADIFGYMTVIVEGGSNYSAGLADRADRKNWMGTISFRHNRTE